MKKYRIIWRITAVGIVLTVILPFILTRTWGLIAFEESSAQVGDTIGGITAPIVGIVSVLLLALTQREQIEYNHEQRVVNDYGLVTALLEQIERASRSIEIRISGELIISKNKVYLKGIKRKPMSCSNNWIKSVQGFRPFLVDTL